jgi:CspA family cold shock protein
MMSASVKKQCSLKWFNSVAGYGFLVPNDGGADIFLHRTVLDESRFPAPLADDVIEVLAYRHEGRNWRVERVLSMRQP